MVTVRVAADTRLRRSKVWMVDMTRIVRNVSQVFRQEFGIGFKIEIFDYWQFEPVPSAGDQEGPLRSAPLSSFLPALIEGLRRAGNGSNEPGDHSPASSDVRSCDILIGLIPEGLEGPVNPGVADYLNGIVIIKYLKKKGGMPYVLLHELCHLFGAIDLREKGTVMSDLRPTFKIGGFTRAIVLANRERSFRPGESPLGEDRLRKVIGLYEERRALKMGEDELAVCLDHLQLMLQR